MGEKTLTSNKFLVKIFKQYWVEKARKSVKKEKKMEGRKGAKKNVYISKFWNQRSKKGGLHVLFLKIRLLQKV